MDIMIESPAGPRTGVVPFEGIADEVSLLKCLALTLSLECQHGVEDVTLRINISNAVSDRLVAVAKVFSQMLTDSRTLSIIIPKPAEVRFQ